MDVFDDIVNHRYDSIEDPSNRLYTAITDNIELLTNNTKVKELWSHNKSRFINNIDFAKTILYNFYTTRTFEKFHELTNL